MKSSLREFHYAINVRVIHPQVLHWCQNKQKVRLLETGLGSDEENGQPCHGQLASVLQKLEIHEENMVKFLDFLRLRNTTLRVKA